MDIQYISLKLSQVHFLGMSLITYKKKYKTYKCLVYYSTVYIMYMVFTSIGQFPLYVTILTRHRSHLQPWQPPRMATTSL